MAWRRPGDKPLSGPMMVSLLTHIYVTRPSAKQRQYSIEYNENSNFNQFVLLNIRLAIGVDTNYCKPIVPVCDQIYPTQIPVI